MPNHFVVYRDENSKQIRHADIETRKEANWIELARLIAVTEKIQVSRVTILAVHNL